MLLRRPPRTITWRLTLKNGCLGPPVQATLDTEEFTTICGWTSELLAMPTGAKRTLRVLELKTIIDMIVLFPGSTIETSLSALSSVELPMAA